jgi:hypothetical protein
MAAGRAYFLRPEQQRGQGPREPRLEDMLPALDGEKSDPPGKIKIAWLWQCSKKLDRNTPGKLLPSAVSPQLIELARKIAKAKKCRKYVHFVGQVLSRRPDRAKMILVLPSAAISAGRALQRFPVLSLIQVGTLMRRGARSSSRRHRRTSLLGLEQGLTQR